MRDRKVPVAEIARQENLKPPTIYKWLREHRLAVQPGVVLRPREASEGVDQETLQQKLAGRALAVLVAIIALVVAVFALLIWGGFWGRLALGFGLAVYGGWEVSRWLQLVKEEESRALAEEAGLAAERAGGWMIAHPRVLLGMLWIVVLVILAVALGPRILSSQGGTTSGAAPESGPSSSVARVGQPSRETRKEVTALPSIAQTDRPIVYGEGGTPRPKQ